MIPPYSIMGWWLLITMANFFFKEIKLLKETQKDSLKLLKKLLKKSVKQA